MAKSQSTRGDRGARSRAQPVSIDEIAETALRILDAEGSDALTMRRLAGEMGVQPMTLYRYLPDKEAILAVVADRLWAPLACVPEGDTWRGQIRAAWLNLHELMQEHPHATPILARAGTYSANAATGTAMMLRVLRDAGFPPALAAELMHSIGATVVGFAFASLWLRQSEVGARPKTPAGEMPRLSDDLRDYAGRVGPSQPEHFETALDILLDAFEHKLVSDASD